MDNRLTSILNLLQIFTQTKAHMYAAQYGAKADSIVLLSAICRNCKRYTVRVCVCVRTCNWR